VLLLHGADDDSVPPSQSIHFAQLYAEAGARPEVHILDNAPHAFWNYYPWFNDSMERAAIFFLQLQTVPVTLATDSGRITGKQERK
jgi:dipeptidyl aminopeptidase/acylaminoacyl peptidase